MLELKQIIKDYPAGNTTVHALKGVDLRFRASEFVSILGPSGCGKTTLLNIIGGLDHYTSGDLVIDGVSTKDYKDRDWDTYRNHSIGFVFQTYNLIPHQTVLKNVELALTLAGVSKSERRERTIRALELVGLGDQLNKRPNQMSGGQMQRVAIARALVNNPDIILADEPTGALDTETGLQVMELLKEVSKDRLVVMVTHNPELAEKYSTRIIRILDGVIVDDSAPLTEAEYQAEKAAELIKQQEELNPAPATDEQAGEQVMEDVTSESTADVAQDVQETKTAPKSSKLDKKTAKKRKKQSQMTVWTAFKLSLNNLLSKRRRTAMVSFAGSIGIIGVSMVLAISAGVQNYIGSMENDMLSGNPVAITQSVYDFTSLMSLSDRNKPDVDLDKISKGDKVYVRSLLETLGTFAQGFERTNTISEAYVHYLSNIPADSVNVVQYKYAFNLTNNVYTNFTVSNNLNSHFKNGESWDYNGGVMSVAAIRSMYSNVLSHVEEYKQWGSMISSVRTFEEVPNNFEFVMSQYDVLAVDYNGQAVTSGYSDDYLEALFEDKSTLIMVLQDQAFNDLMFAEYGFFTEDEFLDYANAGVGDDEEVKGALVGADGIPYSSIIGNSTDKFKFTYYPNDSVYSRQQYKAKPKYSDDAIRSMMSMMGEGGAQFAEMIINARNQGDDALRALLMGFSTSGRLNEADVEKYFEMFRLPSADETTEGYVANAYTHAYTIKQDGVNDITLPAFGTDVGEVEMGVKLILQKKDSVSYGCLDTGLYYTNALTNYILQTEAESEIVKYIQQNGALDNVPCYVDYYYVEDTDEGSFYVFETNQGTIDTGASMMSSIIGSITGTTSTSITAAMLGGSKLPIAVYFYPVDFERKDTVTDYLDAWNRMCDEGSSYTYIDFDGNEVTITLQAKQQITYTDTVGIIIAMINTMIEMITTALVAFTALALVVSTVMIGIITYVSVVERIKEIGVLRAIGARKKDIKRLFNAETFIMGLAAGVVGIAVTYLLSFILNLILGITAGIYTIAALPIWQALVMIAISIGLTLISGLIPAQSAARKDPVVALRTE